MCAAPEVNYFYEQTSSRLGGVSLATLLILNSPVRPYEYEMSMYIKACHVTLNIGTQVVPFFEWEVMFDIPSLI